MRRPRPTEDRNFDDLAARFSRKIYTSLKGEIRLSILKQDFDDYIWPAIFRVEDEPRLEVLDAGGGQGQFALALAEKGCNITLCDISKNMLDLARDRFDRAGLSNRLSLLHTPIQTLHAQLATQKQFDIVLSHAVIEWMLAPQELLPLLSDFLKDDGFLSFTFYNLHGMIFKNLLRGNFSKLTKKEYTGYRGSLTPPNPLDPALVDEWLQVLPLRQISRSGIRVFHDYILDKDRRLSGTDDQLALECDLSRHPAFIGTSRYQHLILEKY